MKPTKKLAAALSILLIMLNVFPTFAVPAEVLKEPEAAAITLQDALPASSSDARPKETPIIEPEEESEIPVLSIELVEDGENPGLYGTLDYIPEDTTHITVQYSFSGSDFKSAVNSDDGKKRVWDLSRLSEEDGQPKTTQLCVGVNDLPLKAYQSGEEATLYIRLEIKSERKSSRTEPVSLPRWEILSLPDTLPEFTASIESTFEGYVLKGTFTDFLPDTSRVRPIYSLDGESYEPIGGDAEPMDWDLSMLETDDPEEQALLQNQICAYATDEPLKSYLEQGLERFYIKLQITTAAGDTYDTQTAVIDRGTPQPPPENTIVTANFVSSMIAVEKGQRPPYTYGKYQITARENATPEDVYALLPDTLPIELRIEQPDNNKVITSGIVECEVTWKELPRLDLTAGEAFTIPDAADELVVPGETEVSTPLGIYVLSDAVIIGGPYARNEIRIVVNAIGAEEKPDISLTGNTKDDFTDSFDPLSLAFRLKPSGATSVKAYSYMEGDEDWTEICELLSFRDIDANQSAELYGFLDILQPDESAYADYLKGEITGFSIGIIIEGGTFDGERVILPWPAEYNPPGRIPELDGAGGNEGNAGSGNGSGDSTEGGQRPDLPDTGTPPVTTPPPDTSKPSGGSGGNSNGSSNGNGTTPGRPEKTEPSAPVLPDSNTTPTADRTEYEDGTVSPMPPADSDTILPTEEAGKTTLPPANQPPVQPESPAETPPAVSQGSNPTEPKVDIAAELPVWNEANPQDQAQEKSDAQVVTRQTSRAEKTGRLPVAAAVLLLGGGIAVVAAFVTGGAAGSMAGTGAVAKLLTALKNFFRRP